MPTQAEINRANKQFEEVTGGRKPGKLEQDFINRTGRVPGPDDDLSPQPAPIQPGQLVPPQIIIPPAPAGPSPQEIALRQQVIDIASNQSNLAQKRFQQQTQQLATQRQTQQKIFNLAQQQAQSAQKRQNELFGFQRQFLESAADQALASTKASRLNQQLQRQALKRTKELLPIEKELLEIQLDQIKRGPKPTPEQLELINESFDASFDIASGDIQEQASQALTQLREELAPSRGLRPTDTPVVDRGARIQREATRQTGQLARQTAQGRATARLNFPLAAQQLTASQTQFQQGLLNSSRQFQQQLAQQTRQSAAGLGAGLATSAPSIPSGLFATSAGLTSSPPSSIPTGGGNLALGLASTLGSQRIQSAQVQRPIVGFPGFAPFPPVSGGGSNLGGIGGLLIGAGAFADAIRS